MTVTFTYARARWNLADIFPGPDSAELQAAVDRLGQLAGEVEAARAALAGIAGEAFCALLAQLDQAHGLKARLRTYASLYFTDDTRNPYGAALTARVEGVLAGVANRLLFFDLWWKGLEGDEADRLLAASAEYRYWLERLRLTAAYTLSEPEERIVNLKNVTGRAALSTLYGAITNRQRFRVAVDGEERELNRGEAIALQRHADAAVRAAAHRAQMGVFEQDSPLLGPIYQSLVRDWANENLALRNYPRPISARNVANDLPDEVIDTLFRVAQDNAGIFQRFFRLKARALGTDRLSRYDLIAPVARTSKTYPYEPAIGLILESFCRFDPRFGELAERMVAERHVDADIRPGKGFLAFCSDPSGVDLPYVNLCYEGGLFDLLTLQHELGHAIHGLLAEGQPALLRFPSLPLAETASLFSEMLQFDDLLGRETDGPVRQALLFGQVDRLYTGIQRQITTATFEIRAHTLVQEGATVDRLAQEWLTCLAEQFGDSVEVPDEFRWEWLGIPHIFDWPFYVYAYAFGQLLVLALYDRYRQEGERFKPGYFRLLSAGGSAAPVALLEQAGVDVRQPAFWQGGYDIIASLVDKLEAL